MQCLKCGANAPEQARFCELCGAALKADAAMPAVPPALAAGECRCGAAPDAIDAQGYCGECGRFAGGRDRDHVELASNTTFGGVTDRGRRHPQNEDDMALALQSRDGRPAHILVVCDGVSSSEHAEQASRVGCVATRDALIAALNAGDVEWDAALRDAVKAANEAVRALPCTPGLLKDPPEATLVAAFVYDGIATIAWVGDSRAYWFADGQALQLTRDHSWINDVVDAGRMTEEEASKAPGAHAITRCLGIAEADDPDGDATLPDVLRFPIPGPGRLLLCSDGLWNYATHVADIAVLIAQWEQTNMLSGQPEQAAADAVGLARSLVTFANAQGGRDNITVVIAQF